MTYDYQLKQGDTAYPLEAYLKRVDGTAINLAGATVLFFMRKEGAQAPVIDGALAAIVDAPAGRVRYGWTDDDVAEAGEYYAHWVITFQDGKTVTVPNTTYLFVRVNEALGSEA